MGYHVFHVNKIPINELFLSEYDSGYGDTSVFVRISSLGIKNAIISVNVKSSPNKKLWLERSVRLFMKVFINAFNIINFLKNMANYLVVCWIL